jgi:surface antigen
MRYLELTAAFLGCAVMLSAADSFVGVWKLNLAKSDYKVGAPPKEQIVTMTEEDGNLHVRVNAVQADGTKTVVNYTVPLEGGLGRMDPSPAYDGITGKHIGPNEREISRLKDGKPVFTARSTVAPDGKTMIGHSKGVSPLGQPVENTLFYEKIK